MSCGPGGSKTWSPRARSSGRVPRGHKADGVALFWLAASAGTAEDDLAAQEPVRVSTVVVCGDCVITMDTVVTLGGLEGEGTEVIAFSSAVAIGPGGRILVTDFLIPRIFLFDMAGTFPRTVGRRGEGPGEYSLIHHVNVGPRYIHVFEHGGRTLLDHDFKFVSRDHFPGQFNQSFMMDEELVAFVTGDGTSLWTISQESTRVTRWDLLPTPAIAQIWDRSVNEWDRHDRGPRGFSSPRPLNTGTMLDENGLWIIWLEPDPDSGIVPSEESRLVTDPPHIRSDSWLELLDPVTGRTLARHFDRGAFERFVPGSRYLISYHETDAGVPYIHLLEPRLSRGTR